VTGLKINYYLSETRKVLDELKYVAKEKREMPQVTDLCEDSDDNRRMAEYCGRSLHFNSLLRERRPVMGWVNQ
jgi:hypothetical protein